MENWTCELFLQLLGSLKLFQNEKKFALNSLQLNFLQTLSKFSSETPSEFEAGAMRPHWVSELGGEADEGQPESPWGAVGSFRTLPGLLKMDAGEPDVLPAPPKAASRCFGSKPLVM